MTTLRSHLRGSAIFCGLSLCCALPSAHAAAPQTESHAAGSGLEEIIVTARRREERIQDVPVAITAFSPESLQQRSIFDANDLQTATPALTTQGGPNGSAFSQVYIIRGQGQTSGVPGAPLGVLPYFADVPTNGIATPFYDIGNVQVLKGPQGTLFGRNTTGGAVLINPAAPKHSFEGYGLARVGNLNLREFEAAVNLPLYDWIALRIAGNSRKRDGYVHNLFDGQDLNNYDGTFGRASLLIDPTDWFHNTTIFDYAYISSRTPAGVLTAVDPNGFAARTYGTLLGNLFFGGQTLLGALAQQQQLGIRTVHYDMAPFTRTNQRTIINTTSLHAGDTPLGSLTVKNIFGYIHSSYRSAQEYDGTPLPVLDSLATIPSDTRQYTEELQLQGETSLLNYVLGGFYYDNGPTENEPTKRLPTYVLFFSLPGNNDSPTHVYSGTKNKSKAVFGQGTIKLDALLSGLSFTGGLRHTWDETTTQTYSLAGGVYGPEHCTSFPGATLANCLYLSSGKWDATTWNVSVDYKITSDMLAYVTARRGYKQGLFNALLSPSDPNYLVQPEFLNDYEAGLKSGWKIGDVSLQLNTAGFYGRYTNIQRSIQTFVNGTVGSLISNAAKAEIYGLEVETEIRPIPDLYLAANYSFTKAKFLEVLDPSVVLQSGGNLSNLPKHKLNLTLGYDKHIGDMGSLGGSVSWYKQSEYFQVDNSAVEPYSRAAPYHLLNARLDWRNIAGSQVSAGLWGKNLTKEVYLVNSANLYSSAGFALQSWSEPRTYGADVQVKF